MHTKCSYAVPEGRACAAHFDVVNPLDKQVIASMGDPTIPDYFRGRAVCPNIAVPQINETSDAPEHIMYGVFEALWLYKHAWRGAGLYYRKGDHQVPQSAAKDKHHRCIRHWVCIPSGINGSCLDANQLQKRACSFHP